MTGWRSPSKRALLALATVVTVASVAAVVAGEYMIEPPTAAPADGATLGVDEGPSPHQDTHRCGMRGGWHHAPGGVLWKA